MNDLAELKTTQTVQLKNFQLLARGLHVYEFLHQLEANPQLWDINRLRTTHEKTAHSQVNDIWIRFNALDENASVDDMGAIWYDAAKILTEAPRHLYGLMSACWGDRMGRAIITKLAPGKQITRHIDYGSPVSHYQRFHLCLKNRPGAVFYCGDESFEPLPGDLFIFDNSKPHWVENNSDDDRITFIMDVRTPLFEHIKVTQGVAVRPAPVKYPTGMSYQVESFRACTAELKEYEHQHWEELALTKDAVPVAMDWPRYWQLEQENKLHLVTVRDDGYLVGYQITFVGGHFHYKDTLHGMVDLYFVAPAYRKSKIGLELLKFAEKSLKELGVVKIITGCKVHMDHTTLFERLGYMFSDKTFMKLI
jgi:GNAT superfamily N-acetyltransferase